MDKKYEILQLVETDGTLTQRQLSERMGLSLGAVNILIKKMLREGLIKLEKIPANRTFYMLTPKGAQEKVEKTLYYVKHYYHFIEATRGKLRAELTRYKDTSTFVLEISDPTLCDIVHQTMEEMKLNVTNTKENSECIVITDGNDSVIQFEKYINIREVMAK